MAEEVTLFKTWSSAFALRVVWALQLKGIQYESVLEDISNKSDLLLHYNPVYKKVPVLLHKGRPILESLIILDYIDETWNQYPLLPHDPYARAMARFWAKFGDDKVIDYVPYIVGFSSAPCTWITVRSQERVGSVDLVGLDGFREVRDKVMQSIWTAFISEGKEQEAALVEASEHLQKLEVELRGKKFFGGDNIGYLDLALGWLANLLRVFEEISSLKVVDGERFPLLCAWLKEFSDAPIIRDCWPPHDKLIPKFIALRQVNRAKSPST